MHDSYSPGQRDFSQFDKLSTEELEELICQDFQLENAEESDMDLILHITEVLEERRKENGKTDDVDSAWKSFNENYRPYPGDGMPLFDFNESENEIYPVKPVRKLRMGARVASIAAIIAVVIVAGTVTAHALGFDLLGQIARWTQETFGFVSRDSELSEADPVFESFEITLKEYGITGQILPTWIPDGYNCKEVTVTETPQYIRFLGRYGSKPNELSITINRYYDSNEIVSPTYEVDEGADIYVFNGIEHYIMVNSDYTRISWIQGSNECSILCALSREDAEKMVNSIYERK